MKVLHAPLKIFSFFSNYKSKVATKFDTKVKTTSQSTTLKLNLFSTKLTITNNLSSFGNLPKMPVFSGSANSIKLICN